MKQIVLAASCLLILCKTLAQQTYQQLWSALAHNQIKKASDLLKITNDGKTVSPDSYLTNLYLQTYNGKDADISDFENAFYDKVENPYPYIYALWFNNAVLGAYGKKKYTRQVKLIDRILNDANAPGTLVAAAHYQKGMHFLYSNEMDKANQEFSQIGNIRNWQFTGPFENISGSGIDKDFGPLRNAGADAVFKSSTNAQVKWFTPVEQDNDGWTPVCFQFNKKNATVFAQTFVHAANEQEVLFNVGVTGAIKVWLNDVLLIAETKEHATELDTYTKKCTLKKGTNRILVQLCYTDQAYPNFNVRLTDERFRAIPGISGSGIYKPYNKSSDQANELALLPHFAEHFFQERIAKQPGNLLNYLLLTDVYMRNKKTQEARTVIEKALEQAPDNNLLHMKLVEVLTKENNQSKISEEIEKIKKNDPESVFALDHTIKNNMDNEKYDDVQELVDKREKLYGEDENTTGYKLLILAHEKKYDELIKAGEDAYKKYPGRSDMLEMMYAIKKNVYKDNQGAMEVYVSYLKDNFNYQVMKKYASLLAEQGQDEKSEQVQLQLMQYFPYDPGILSDLAAYYYSGKKYDKAEGYINKALLLSPYNEDYWEKLGDIKSENKQKNEAVYAYERSLQYDPDQYDVINKIRKLKGKQESYKLLQDADIDQVIKNDRPEEARNSDYGYYFMHDEKNVILHPGGATEEYYLLMIKITNEKGIEKYKESSIGYSSSQTLLIEKAEVIKSSGAKVEGERNGNDVVFSNLEVGDVIVFKYRLQNYVYGRFAKEYWDRYYFGGQIYSAYTKYNLLVPVGQELKYEFTNTNIQPSISRVEDFTQYTWEMSKPEPLKDEPLMPNICDVGTILHISTVPSWHDIAAWYADIVNNKSAEDFEVVALFNQLFPGKLKDSLSQFKRARLIYNYIEKNIRYSSVSFRQSAYVPQRASVTLTTRLGDCKDLSNLFVTLCRMAGIDCNMVLVSTRDNGEKELVLPSMDFNHCIVKAVLDNKEYFIELTDNYLPFASLPNSLTGAAILEIPSNKEKTTAVLKKMEAGNRTKDVIKRVVYIKPTDDDLVMETTCVKYGHFAGDDRDRYGALNYEKQLNSIEKKIAGAYRNNIKVERITFDNLAGTDDSLSYHYQFRVKDEIVDIGSLKAFRITYPDVVATLDNFSADTRTFPVNYNSYEDADRYETVVNITVDEGRKFVELPTDQSFGFKNFSYSISYRLAAPNKLVVTRQFISERKTIPAEDYPAFKAFFQKIVKAEQKFLAFK